MLDILKGKEPTENYLIICRGPQSAVYLFKKTAELYKSIYPESNCLLSHTTIYLYKSPFRIRFVGRNDADRADRGFHGKIMYDHQVEQFLKDLGVDL